jgi:hypothetical protein
MGPRGLPLVVREEAEVSEPVARPELEVMDPVVHLEVSDVSEPVVRPELEVAEPVAATVITYNSSMEDLRKAFLETHPGWTFPITHGWSKQLYPSPPLGDPRLKKGAYMGDPDKSPWVLEWYYFIYKMTKEVCKGELGADLVLREQIQPAVCFFRNLEAAVAVWDHYTGLCKKQRAEKDKQAALQKETRAKAMAAAEEKWRLTQERAAQQARVEAVARANKISALAEKERLTSQDAEAVLAHLAPAGGYQKDTRLALQVINRYAAETGVRVEDAVTILREYI